MPLERAAVVVDDAEDVVLRCFRPLLAAVRGAPEVNFDGDRLPLPTFVELGAAGWKGGREISDVAMMMCPGEKAEG